MVFLLHVPTMFKTLVQVCFLSVLSFVDMKTIDVSGHVGSTLTFQCSGWDLTFNTDRYKKYFCKDPCKYKKDVIVRVAVGKTAHKDRISISDMGQSLNVTFTDLKMSDSRKYYCGVDAIGNDEFIDVNLTVKYAVQTSAETDSVSSSVSPGVFSVSTSVSGTSSTVHMTTNTPAGRGTAGMVSFLSVGLCLAVASLLLLLLLMKTVMKRKKSAPRRIEQRQEDAQTEPEYTEIRFEDQHAGRQSAADSLYANCSYRQDTELAADGENKHVSPVSSCASKVAQEAACAENRAENLLSDSVYSVAQRPQNTERPGEDCLYALAKLPPAT